MGTLGENRVRVDFNTTNSDDVTAVNVSTAKLIDMCEQHKLKDYRLAALAQTAFEEAAMWAVKLMTATPPKDKEA